MKDVIDRSFKICNNWNSFHNDIETLSLSFLKVHIYPLFLINKVIKKFLNHTFSSNQDQFKDTFDVYYFKDPIPDDLKSKFKINLNYLR